MQELLLDIRGLRTQFFTGRRPGQGRGRGQLFAGEGRDGGRGGRVRLREKRHGAVRAAPHPGPSRKIVDGEIIFEGTDLLELSSADMRRIRGNDISMIFQEPMTSSEPGIHHR